MEDSSSVNKTGQSQDVPQLLETIERLTLENTKLKLELVRLRELVFNKADSHMSSKLRDALRE
jgi:regulator of replication initiation timing